MRKVAEDSAKAKSLKKMAEKIMQRLEDTDKKEYPSQSLADYYKILHSLMEALAAICGVKSSGEGAHKKLIDWVSEEIQFKEGRRRFLQQLRKYRNRIVYEGFMIDEGYIERNGERIEKIYREIKVAVEEQLEA